MNRIGLDFNAVGNHEFDEGVDELLRIQNGRLPPGRTGARTATPLRRRDVPVPRGQRRSTGRDDAKKTVLPLLRHQGVRRRQGGLHRHDAGGHADHRQPGGRGGPRRSRTRPTPSTRSSRELKQKGVEAIVVLVHEGGLPATDFYNGCAGISGPIVDIVNRLDDEVDLVISGHTHQAYNCVIDDSS